MEYRTWGMFSSEKHYQIGGSTLRIIYYDQPYPLQNSSSPYAKAGNFGKLLLLSIDMESSLN